MREIKFRVWDKGVKTMLDHGFTISAKGDVSFYWNKLPVSSTNAILMQYTGLKDKNGKEIYEGDILENGDYDENAHAWNEWVREVEWDNDNTQFIGIGGERYEVIGNIYENPELLK